VEIVIKVNKKMLEKFLEIMDDYNEFVFGTDKDIQRQLELCLNTQGYWSGCSIRVYYDEDTKEFFVESRF
jgi:hypothetical protein